MIQNELHPELLESMCLENRERNDDSIENDKGLNSEGKDNPICAQGLNSYLLMLKGSRLKINE
jgi:hypothetical protein